MNIMLHIRTVVFNETQQGFANIAKTKQATISRWESSNENVRLIPNREQLKLIRDEASKRELSWSDSWFFETPKERA